MNALIAFAFIIQAVVCDYDRRIITSRKYSKFSSDVVPTIVNGEPADVGQVPYLVSLKEPVHKFEEGQVAWKNVCGGTIIDAKRVLTAAHCFETSDFYFAKHPQLLRYVAGNLRNSIIHSGATETTTEGQWRILVKVILHNEFIFPTNDIAIAFVDTPWRFTDNVNPIKMATKNIGYAKYCAAAGYGRVGPTLRDAISPILLIAQISILPRWRCSALWEMNMNSFVCSDTAVTDVARGDSGGPLVCNGTFDPQEKKGEVLLVGIVSGKNYDKTSLYTRVSAYKSWIRNNDANKLSVSMYVSIILLILIYLLFFYVFIYSIIHMERKENIEALKRYIA